VALAVADKIVYSSEYGDLRQSPEKEKASSHRESKKPGLPRDGIVRVRRENNGRGGKTVTVIYGLPLSEEKMYLFAAKVKRRFGTGGTVRDGAVIVQGDRVDDALRLVAEDGFTVKKAGG